MMTELPPETATPIDFAPCGICGRTFNPDVLPRHTRVCQKQQEASSKRRQFDSSKMRATGTDLESFLRTRGGRPSTSEQRAAALAAKKKGAWKRKHEDFIQSIRGAREVTDPHSGGRSKPAAPNPDYVQCPHCQRRFQDATAERHIPFCKEKTDRIERKPLSSKAKNSLSKRIQYKPPPLKKRSSISNASPSTSNPPGASVVLRNTSFTSTYTISDSSQSPQRHKYDGNTSSTTTGGRNRGAANGSNTTGIPRSNFKPKGGPLTRAAFPKHSPLRNPLGSDTATVSTTDQRHHHNQSVSEQESGTTANPYALPPSSNSRPALRQTSFSKRSAGKGGGGVITKQRGGLDHRHTRGIGSEDDYSDSASRSPIHAKSSIRQSPVQNGVETHSRQNHSQKKYTASSAYEYSSDEHMSPGHGHLSQGSNGVFHSKKGSNAQTRLASIGGSDHSISSASEEDLAVVMEQHSQTHTLAALKTKPGLLTKRLDSEGSFEKIPSLPSTLGQDSRARSGSSDSHHRHTSGGSSSGCRGQPLNAHGMPMSKFCYECGARFPVPQAKYCCECGTRRI